jgi:NAD(P)-dependent dehydrogenase (short-subunit alcohol dehydrogenase family)
VNIGSIGGKMVLPWSTMYSASKYAVGALTEGLRMELRREGVHAMLVCPGYVKTGFQEHVCGGRVPPDVLRSRRYAITAGGMRRRHPPRSGARCPHRYDSARRLDSGGCWPACSLPSSKPAWRA